MCKRQFISSDEKYVNPFTDFGFKRLFGENPNKALLIDFLNEVLKGQAEVISDITYLKNEHLSTTAKERKCVFDIYCENERGEKFIVELQKGEQTFFKDRALYYATFPIRDQAMRGDWAFYLQPVYTIAISDFVFEGSDRHPTKYRSDVQLIDRDTRELFYDKLTFIYFEMPKFTKDIDELESKYEKWLYLLRHLHLLDSIPAKFQECIFEQLFEVAEVAKFSREQILSYEDSLKAYRDWKSVLDTALRKAVRKATEKGLTKGTTEAKTQIAIAMLQESESVPKIAKYTGLPEAEIERLKKEQNL